VQRSARWDGSLLNPPLLFDPSFTRLAATRAKTVGYRVSSGTYVPVGPVVDSVPAPTYAFLRDRLVTTTKDGTLVYADRQAPVPGYASDPRPPKHSEAKSIRKVSFRGAEYAMRGSFGGLQLSCSASPTMMPSGPRT
jgi:hypothetical protein